MQQVVVAGIEPAGVVRVVDARTYARGVLLAARRAVGDMEWDDLETALYAEVRDGDGVHEAVAYFEHHRARLEYVFGECTCPAGPNCAHVVAAVLVAAAGTATGAGSAGAHQPWERTLRALFAPEPPSVDDLGQPVPLAVELSLSGGGAGPVELSARIVRPGRSGWVAGGMTWHRLDQSTGDCRPAHVRVLKELYALSTAAAGHSGYYSGYYTGRHDRTIDLAGVGRGIWSVLEEAAEVGLQVVHARKRFGAVDHDGRAALCLDVTAGADPGALEIVPALRLDGADAADPDALPVLVLGTAGHGVVHVSRAQVEADADPAHWRFRLARLTAPASSALRRLVVDDGGLSVPGDQRQRFLDEFYPRLSRLAPVASSDGSFTPPAVAAPQLVLRAAHGPDHALTCEWEWAYAVGDGLRFPLSPAGADEGVRDAARERAVLDALHLPPVADDLLRTDGPGSSLRPCVQLDGLDTMRICTEVLPLLVDAPDVVVEVTGRPAAYREAGDLLRVGVSTTESEDGGTDWFDLGVRVTVAGRVVPFGELFAALAAGESHLLLPDGAYFSLDKPELQALRALIEEARSLQDSPAGPLRLSRFQAGLWEELAALGVVDAQARAWRQQVTGLLGVKG